MPTLRCFFAIYTDGKPPLDSFRKPANTEVFLGEMATLALPSKDDELFGPHAKVFGRYKPKKGYLLALSKEVKGASTPFFTEARRVLLEATEGLDGWALDVLRLWPFPLATASEALPEEFLAEDLFSVGFEEMGLHGYRAETFGLAKLGQRELSFEFEGRELLEEAALFCGHIADWILDHHQRIDHGQSLAFGFDRVSFFAAQSDQPFRGWHPEVMQRILPAELFPGVGVLEVKASDGLSPDFGPLTPAFLHAQSQRATLEELDLTGDAPHASATAELKGSVGGLKQLVATREEPSSSRDSGWRFRSTAAGTDVIASMVTLATVGASAPDLIRYLALPAGIRLEWSAQGVITVDVSRIDITELDDEDGE